VLKWGNGELEQKVKRVTLLGSDRMLSRNRVTHGSSLEWGKIRLKYNG